MEIPSADVLYHLVVVAVGRQRAVLSRVVVLTPSSGDDLDLRLEHLAEQFGSDGDTLVVRLEGSGVAAQTDDDGVVRLVVAPDLTGQALLLVAGLQDVLGQEPGDDLLVTAVVVEQPLEAELGVGQGEVVHERFVTLRSGAPAQHGDEGTDGYSLDPLGSGGQVLAHEPDHGPGEEDVLLQLGDSVQLARERLERLGETVVVDGYRQPDHELRLFAEEVAQVDAEVGRDADAEVGPLSAVGPQLVGHRECLGCCLEHWRPTVGAVGVVLLHQTRSGVGLALPDGHEVVRDRLVRLDDAQCDVCALVLQAVAPQDGGQV